MSRIPVEQVIAVIPARWASSRFPGKPLADLEGRPLLAHVVERVRRARRVGTILVATDHEGIARAARAAGAEAVLTRAEHATGSDRIGEAVAGRTEEIVLNVQGDEPLVPPTAIDRLVELLEEDPAADVSTLACPLPAEGPEARREWGDPNVVKVVASPDGRALYFSRAPIPGRHPGAAAGPAEALRHVGLYGFRREAFAAFLRTAPTPLERVEGLEQLRFLETGRAIVVGRIEALPPGVDTPGDLRRVAAILARGGGPPWALDADGRLG